MIHEFNIELAKKYGVLEAVLLETFSDWLKHLKEEVKMGADNYHDGKIWICGSVKMLHEQFPYASEKKIRNALKHLEDEGLLISGNFNKTQYDRTKWYTITQKGESEIDNA